MEYCIMCIGKIKDLYYRNMIEEIQNRVLKKQSRLTIMEFPDEKIPENVNEKIKNSILEKEGKKILSQLKHNDYVVALCIEGKEITTVKHKEAVIKAKDMGDERVIYMIGGSLGLMNELKERANLKMSFSKMTFPHQLMRVVLCEEIESII